MLGSRGRPGRGGGRAGRSAARRSRGGTTALTRHFECVDVLKFELDVCTEREEEESRYVWASGDRRS